MRDGGRDRDREGERGVREVSGWQRNYARRKNEYINEYKDNKVEERLFREMEKGTRN